MQRTFITALSCLWVLIFVALIVYVFPGPRHAALRLLTAREGNDQYSVQAVHLLAAADASNVQADTTSTNVADTTPTTYEYKLMLNVDPCTMSKLGADGWNAQQFGGNILTVGGADANCLNKGLYNGFDWILFTRVHNSN